MEGILLFIATEVIITNAIAKYTYEKRKALLKRWLCGQVTLQEIYYLKQAEWFQRIYKPPKPYENSFKKIN